jgi:hypothetical protein
MNLYLVNEGLLKNFIFNFDDFPAIQAVGVLEMPDKIRCLTEHEVYICKKKDIQIDDNVLQAGEKEIKLDMSNVTSILSRIEIVKEPENLKPEIKNFEADIGLFENYLYKTINAFCVAPLNTKGFLDLPLYKIIAKKCKNFIVCEHPDLGSFVTGKFENGDVIPLSTLELDIAKGHGFITGKSLNVVKFEYNGIDCFKSVCLPIENMIIINTSPDKTPFVAGIYINKFNSLQPLTPLQKRCAQELYGFCVEEDV